VPEQCQKRAETMITEELYSRGRLSAAIRGPHGERLGRADYDLISKLRAARVEGDEAMVAAERYDPDFSVKLSACIHEADARALLDAWLDRRVEVLKTTQAQLRRIWEAAQSGTRDANPLIVRDIPPLEKP
jgi:hypothetical protein